MTAADRVGELSRRQGSRLDYSVNRQWLGTAVGRGNFGARLGLSHLLMHPLTLAVNFLSAVHAYSSFANFDATSRTSENPFEAPSCGYIGDDLRRIESRDLERVMKKIGIVNAP